MVIDRRAMFIVRIAKNLEGKSNDQRNAVLDRMDSTVVRQVYKAAKVMRETRLQKQ